jgi:K+-transporting ATPase c subunit
LYPSASMLDPHISWMGGVIQLASVAKARGMDINDLYRFLDSYSHSKDMINVLDLNLALDKEFSHT